MIVLGAGSLLAELLKVIDVVIIHILHHHFLLILPTVNFLISLTTFSLKIFPLTVALVILMVVVGGSHHFFRRGGWFYRLCQVNGCGVMATSQLIYLHHFLLLLLVQIGLGCELTDKLLLFLGQLSMVYLGKIIQFLLHYDLRLRIVSFIVFC